ncbi:MAG: glycosyltransferase [Acidobacteriota bacterium]|nr:MAG: glycosyltransferase [Acidobacteriota bacterium]
MKMTLITPSFNQGSYIEETIRSVIDQRAANLQYIIIDGSSSDETISILRKYKDRLDLWLSEPDNGQSQAINKGFMHANGDIISWLNSDDLLIDGSLNSVIKLFRSQTNDIGLIHGGVVIFNNAGVLHNDFGYEQATAERYLSGMAFPQPASFFRRALLDRVGFLDETLHYGMDYDLFARLALVTRFHKVDTVFAKYRIHDNSKTVSGDDRFIYDWARTFTRILLTLKSDKTLMQLQGLNLFDDALFQNERAYDFDFHPPKVDFDLMLFYFLSYVFKSDYRNAHFDRAEHLAEYLMIRFPNHVAGDDELSKTISRVKRLPASMIRLLRRIRSFAR